MTRAIVLAGGYGSRLMPYTRLVPKHLLPVGDQPLIVHQLRRLASVGIDHVTIATGHLGDQLPAALGDGTAWNLTLEYSHEDAPRGTGGALAAAARRSPGGGSVVVLNGDLLSSHDLSAQVAAADGSDLTLHVREVPDARRFGNVEVVRDRVTAFEEKPEQPRSQLINAGTYVFAAAVLDALPHDVAFSLERDVLPALVAASDRTVTAYREQAYFRDVGTPADLVAASADAVLGRIPGVVVPGVRGGTSWVAPDAAIGPDVRLLRGTAVHAGAVVGEGAHLDGCVVLAGARVGPGASVREEVVGWT